MNIGFIGLGVMGSGMCSNVVRKSGAPVHVFDMAPGAVAEQVAGGAIAAASVAEVARAADVICLSLPGGKQVAAVCAEIWPLSSAPSCSIPKLATCRSPHRPLPAK